MSAGAGASSGGAAASPPLGVLALLTWAISQAAVDASDARRLLSVLVMRLSTHTDGRGYLLSSVAGAPTATWKGPTEDARAIGVLEALPMAPVRRQEALVARVLSDSRGGTDGSGGGGDEDRGAVGGEHLHHTQAGLEDGEGVVVARVVGV